VRVVAGEFRGRRLVAPPGGDIRPTTDKVRVAVFNALTSMDVLDGVVVADLFAGSGALGIEAISRGAARCTFVERDRRALAALRANIDALGIAARARVVAGDAERAAVASRGAAVVFADPPYGYDRWERLLTGIESELVVAEAGTEIAAPDGWSTVRAKRYGRTWVTFLRRDG
jgi:16S rRNA (guanine966-N2)-methyltransferase